MAAANAAKAEERDVVYPETTANVCCGETAITAEDAKELLGWEEVSEGGGTYIREVFALAKVRVRCSNNVTNRPIYANVVQTLKQEILRKRWLLNGEPIIVGRTGLLLNGQHTLLALVLACLEWEADRERWAEYWPTAPTIDKTVVSGIDESDGTVNTMDTCKPRSLADVIYRSEYFATLSPGDRRSAARMADYAIRLLWHRTGAGLDAFAPRRTHAESLDFIARHPRLLDAVKHVHEEDGKEGRLSRYLSPGYAAGLLYLMGCSTTDSEAYRNASHPDESTLDWTKWTSACDFIVLLAAGGKETAAIRSVMARSIEEGGLGNAERWSIVANAWLAHSNGDAITEESLQLEYLEDGDGNRRLAEHPSVGGIDLGDPSTADEERIIADDPSPEVIKEEASKLRKKGKKDASVAKPNKKKLIPSRANTHWAKGDVAWVRDQDGEHYLGELTEDPWDCDDDNCRAAVQDSAGKEWEVAYADLSLERPGKPADKPSIRFPKSPKTKPFSDGYKVGEHLWVRDKSGDPWRGKVIEVSKNSVKMRVDTGHQGAGNVKMVWSRDLSREQPEVA
jgi:hypothetical protein